MKKLLFIMCAVATLFTACKISYPVAQESGKDDQAYLLFASPEQYAGKQVQVTIDGGTAFSAQVIKNKKALRQGTQYAISTGTRNIVVTYQGNVLYQKKIFVSTQEVKQIQLP